MGHPESAMPFCVKHYRVLDGEQRLVAERKDNHQTQNTLTFLAALPRVSIGTVTRLVYRILVHVISAASAILTPFLVAEEL